MEFECRWAWKCDGTFALECSWSPAIDALTWTPKSTSLIGLPRSPRKRKQSTRVVRNRPTKQQKRRRKAANTAVDRNPKAFAFSNPGKLARQAARSHDVCHGLPIANSCLSMLTVVRSIDQGKAPPCPSRRPHPGRAATAACRHRWPPRGGKNNTTVRLFHCFSEISPNRPHVEQQVLGSTICKGDNIGSGRAHHHRYLQETAVDLHRMSERARGDG